MEPCSKWHSRKRAAWKLRRTEAEVNELIDFTFAELNRRVGRAGFFAQSASFGTTNSTSVEHDRSGRHSRDAAKRGYAIGSRPWMRGRC